MLNTLRRDCTGEVFDYGFLMAHLHDFKAPHRKITTLLQSGAVIRVKKGLYVFGEEYRRAPIHRGLIANLLFGPSYVSGEYALSYYGFIPERVSVVTSMTTKRKKRFDTPIGVFTYDYIQPQRFAIGVNWETLDDQNHFLIACPEKALADTIEKYRDLKTKGEMRQHLLDNMRIDVEELHSLDLGALKQITDCYQIPVIRLLYQTLAEDL